MKILFLILLTQVITAPTDKRVVIIGVDGLVPSCLNLAKLNAFEELKSNGSWTDKARGAIWGYSGPSWSNLLCGIDTEDSGIVNNDWQPPILSRQNSPITPITGLDPLPCMFGELKKNNKDLIIKFTHSWDFLLYFGSQFNPNTVDDEEYCVINTDEDNDICDKKVKDDVIKFIDEGANVVVAQFRSADNAGKEDKDNFCNEKYNKKLAIINQHIMDIINELKTRTKAAYDDVTIIVTSDHGWYWGPVTNKHIQVPWIIKGPGIKKNNEVKDLVKTLITPNVVLKELGYGSNSKWRGKVPKEIYITSNEDNKGNKEELEFLK